MIATTMTAMTSRTVATAAASPSLSTWIRLNTNIDATWVFCVPAAMSTTEPYSPMARANASAEPERTAGRIAGRTMRRNTVTPLAPSEVAASSASRSRTSSTGCTVRTTNGRVTNSNATTTPARAPARSRPMGLLSP